MPGPGKPSEFGGKIQRNGVQPPPHVPTASEELMLTYTTGDPTGTLDRDMGETFNGLLPLDQTVVPEPTASGYEGPEA